VELIGPYLVGCLLLVSAGVMKAVRPDDTARALAPLLPGWLAHMPFGRVRTVLRTVSCLEAGLGLTALVFPRPITASLVAASYLGFAVVVAYARSEGGALASCGCFGTPDTPATMLHVVVDLVLAISGLVVAVTAPTSGSILTVLAHEPLHGWPMVVMIGVGAWLTYLTLSLLGALQAARLAVAPRGRRR
jgi:Methylamine utilisation protein MauE